MVKKYYLRTIHGVRITSEDTYTYVRINTVYGVACGKHVLPIHGTRIISSGLMCADQCD